MTTNRIPTNVDSNLKPDKNNQSDLWNIISLLKKVIIASFITILLIVAGFILYLVFGTDSSSVSTTGVYNLVNSESGEIIATDLTPEQIELIVEMLNGEY